MQRSQYRIDVVRDVAAIVVGTLVMISAYFPQPSVAQEEPVFRAPFVLRLRIDNEHYYEENFDRVPYVANNEVYLFAGETFGINVTVADNQITRISYARDSAKADIEFKFSQEKSPNGLLMMLLMTRNKLKRSLFLDAVMTVPKNKGIYKTSILPVKPGLKNVESWPHPIVQLVLSEFRFSENGAKQAER